MEIGCERNNRRACSGIIHGSTGKMKTMETEQRRLSDRATKVFAPTEKERSDADGVSAAFLRLVERVSRCRACPRMEGRTRVLSAANGNLHAQILFVAEAPGRFGGDRTGIPLFADQTGRNFRLLLE